MTVETVKTEKRPFKLDTHLRILSIFQTFDGEQSVYGMGWPATFVRLSGCVGIYCKYCDTKYSWDPSKGRDMLPEEIVRYAIALQRGGSDKITITGGEPLQQDGLAFRKFINLLIDRGHAVTLETAGTEDMSWLLASGVSVVADYKLPSSGVTSLPHTASLVKMSGNHVIKMVAQSSEDLDHASEAIKWLRREGCGARIAIGPVDGGELVLGEVSDYILGDKDLRVAGVGLNYQLHKVMYPDQFRDEEEGGLDFTPEKGE